MNYYNYLMTSDKLLLLHRFIIGMSAPKIINLDPEDRLQEGQMFGTEISLSCLERKSEETLGFLFMQIFVEKIYFSM